MESLTFPIIYVISRLGLGQKLTLLGALVLPPQCLLAYRYVQLLDVPAARFEVVVFFCLSSLLTTYFLLGYFFAGRHAQRGELQPESGECDL